jgi:hypothetical protein
VAFSVRRVKPVVAVADTSHMLKRAILWPLGVTVFVSMFFAAASISKVVGEEWDNGILSNVVTRCGGFNPLMWFSNGCSDLLLTRFAPLALGVGVLAMCIYFAERNREQRSRAGGGHIVQPSPSASF